MQFCQRAHRHKTLPILPSISPTRRKTRKFCQRAQRHETLPILPSMHDFLTHAKSS